MPFLSRCDTFEQVQSVLAWLVEKRLKHKELVADNGRGGRLPWAGPVDCLRLGSFAERKNPGLFQKNLNCDPELPPENGTFPGSNEIRRLGNFFYPGLIPDAQKRADGLLNRYTYMMGVQVHLGS